MSALYTLQTNLIFQGLHLGVFLFYFSTQDPLDPAGTAIVISSLVPGGVAERGGQILPGDRLVFVNEKHLDGATLTEAVEVLKSVPPGTVSLGICKPLVVRTDFNYVFSLISSHGVRRVGVVVFVGRIQCEFGKQLSCCAMRGPKVLANGQLSVQRVCLENQHPQVLPSGTSTWNWEMCLGRPTCAVCNVVPALQQPS